MKGSVYMRWAKEHAAARYNLANSGILGVSTEDLELEPGDILATGTNHRGLNAFHDGDVVELPAGVGDAEVVREPPQAGRGDVDRGLSRPSHGPSVTYSTGERARFRGNAQASEDGPPATAVTNGRVERYLRPEPPADPQSRGTRMRATAPLLLLLAIGCADPSPDRGGVDAAASPTGDSTAAPDIVTAAASAEASRDRLLLADADAGSRTSAVVRP